MVHRRNLAAILVVTVAAAVLLASSFGDRAFAAQTAQVGGNSLKISPVRQDVTMNPGASITIPVFIENISSVPATLHMSVNDFTSSNNESGQPSIILDDNQYAPTHSFKRFASTVPNFNLGGFQTKEIDVPVTVPKGSAGGGYYGAIRFQPASPVGSKNLNLSASVATLVLLKVNGNIVEKMNMASFDVRRNNIPSIFFTTGKGLVSVSRFQNTGNIQLEPFGKVELKRFGKVIGSYEVNNESPRGNVLPDSVRRFDTALSKLGTFGKYEVYGNFGYGSTGQLLTANTTFYVIPLAYILGGIAFVLLLIILIFVLPRMIRAYNRRVLRRATRRR